MSNDEINIAIAEACGWKREQIADELCGTTFEAWTRGGKRLITRQALPDYCADLNAMHAAESQLDGMIADTRSLYYDYILLQCAELFEKRQDGLKRDPFDRDWAVLRSTARQRAEAFLSCLGKWKD